MSASTLASKVIKARPDEIYEVFMDPAILVEWLPPGEMTGRIHEFDGRPGGSYRMSLLYPPDEPTLRGKTADREDMVTVRFVALEPASRIVEAVTFHSSDPALMGEMILTATFDAVPDGTRVTIECTNLPSGLRPEDNEAGTRESLENLARRFA